MSKKITPALVLAVTVAAPAVMAQEVIVDKEKAKHCSQYTDMAAEVMANRQHGEPKKPSMDKAMKAGSTPEIMGIYHRMVEDAWSTPVADSGPEKGIEIGRFAAQIHLDCTIAMSSPEQMKAWMGDHDTSGMNH